ncbi:hypothetical protein KJI95_11475 [Shewanella sp. JM162201]|uniref:Uncharacterized protein n=1 Tax=Shewanella jiangmenensis TaxID=2837387 RepID=A0ABS5V3Y8_9GAMM|nr:hypothetical protein [Shewanella jiangmenensis]MBT1445140.1 hypothetical protein [Shewanella jiangmenensis]
MSATAKAIAKVKVAAKVKTTAKVKATAPAISRTPLQRAFVWLTGLALIVSSLVFAGDYDALIKADKRESAKSQRLDNHSEIKRKEIALDSDGNPIPIPSDTEPGLEFSMDEYLQSAQGASGSTTPVASPKRPSATSTAQKPTKKQSAKKESTQKRSAKKSAGRGDDYDGRVANDPGCRWLDGRIRLLQQFIASKAAGSHHRDELDARQSEWRCMDCGGAGPNGDDHARCQYRR